MGVTQAKLSGDFSAQSAIFEIRDGLRGRFELFAVGFARFFQYFCQGGLLLPSLGSAFAVLGGDVFFRHLHACVLG